jgi:hypothetical protein
MVGWTTTTAWWTSRASPQFTQAIRAANALLPRRHKAMLEISTGCAKARGDGQRELEDLADYVSRSSLCAWQDGAQPGITTRAFREKYEQQLHEERWPAGNCSARS